MSLAMFAAPFDEEPSQVYMNNDSSIQKKKMTKTLKKYPPINRNNAMEDNIQQKVDYQKVNQVMRAMSNLPSNDDSMGDFNPPPPPQSSGVQSTIMRENMSTIDEPEMSMPHVNANVPYQSTQSNALFSSNNSILNIPNYENMYNNTPYNTPSNLTTVKNEQNVLIDKLNYMIHLLEEQQDERTGNVMEELILYSFLGVFIIFIVDSFCQIGKYTR